MPSLGPDIWNCLVLSEISVVRKDVIWPDIAMKKHHDRGNAYKENVSLTVVRLQFQRFNPL